MNRQKNVFTLLALIGIVCSSLITNAQDWGWAKRLGTNTAERGISVASDAAGNVYTTGYFGNTVDFNPGTGVADTAFLTSLFSFEVFVTKFDAAGNFVWAKQVNGTGNNWGMDIAADAAGNVYVTGKFIGTADFDPGTGTFDMTAAGAPGNEDIFVLKLNTNGDFVWARQMGGDGIDYGQSIAVDTGGNVYTTGFFMGTADFDPGVGSYTRTAANMDVFVSKLDSSGTFVWAKQIGGSSVDAAFSIELDQDANVHVAGRFRGLVDFDPGTGTYPLTAARNDEVFILKLNTSGEFVWARQMGGTFASSMVSLSALSIDKWGNCFSISGGAVSTASNWDFDPGPGTHILTVPFGGRDFFVTKMDAAGTFQWVRHMGGPDADNAMAIATDISGNVYTAGSFWGTVDFNPDPVAVFNLSATGYPDVFLQKMDTAGHFQWAKKISGNGTSNVPFGLVIDAASGAALITGEFTGTTDFDPGAGAFNMISAGEQDIFTCKYFCTDTSFSVITTEACRQYILNETTYTASGNYVQKFTNAAGCDSSVLLNLVINNVDASVTVSSATLTANTAGAEYQWINCTNGNAPIAGATAQSYTAGENGSYAVIVTTGDCADTSECHNIVLTGIGSTIIKENVVLYPNPANDRIIISKSRGFRDASVRLVNLVGQPVFVTSHFTGNDLTCDIKALAPGIYFVEIEEQGIKLRRKLLKK